MFSLYTITAVLSFTSVACAMPKAAPVALEASITSTTSTCWVGPIHGHCHGHDNGCTSDGILVSSHPLYTIRPSSNNP